MFACATGLSANIAKATYAAEMTTEDRDADCFPLAVAISDTATQAPNASFQIDR